MEQRSNTTVTTAATSAPASPAKIAFIGSHGVGKTTLCYGLAARLKARDVSCEVVHEVARRCPLPINHDTTSAAQAWIVHNQIAEELVAGERYPVVVCDRSAIDNYVYLLLANGRDEALDGLIDAWMKSYSLLIRVPIIEDPRPDGVRSSDPHFQRAVEARLDRELARRNLALTRLDPNDRDGWLDAAEKAALDLLEPPQLSLLDEPDAATAEPPAEPVANSVKAG